MTVDPISNMKNVPVVEGTVNAETDYVYALKKDSYGNYVPIISGIRSLTGSPLDGEYKTDNYTATSADCGKLFLFEISSNKTFTFPAAASLYDWFYVTITLSNTIYQLSVNINAANSWASGYGITATTDTMEGNETFTYYLYNNKWYIM